MAYSVTTTDTETDRRGLVNKIEKGGGGEREKRDSCNLGNVKEMNNNQQTNRNILYEIE
jgi:hypothetical protein